MLWRLARVRSQHWRHAGLMWVLFVSILLRFDPPLIVVYLDPDDDASAVAETVAREACPHLQVDGVPLPVPFEAHWFRKAGEDPRYVPDVGRHVEGLLTSCPNAVSVQR
jgi:hypothetical protein